jgi:hypothetical protein
VPIDTAGLPLVLIFGGAGGGAGAGAGGGATAEGHLRSMPHPNESEYNPIYNTKVIIMGISECAMRCVKNVIARWNSGVVRVCISFSVCVALE